MLGAKWDLPQSAPVGSRESEDEFDVEFEKNQVYVMRLYDQFRYAIKHKRSKAAQRRALDSLLHHVWITCMEDKAVYE